MVLAAADALVASGMYRTAMAFLREHLDERAADDVVGRGRLLVGAGNAAYYAGRDDDADRASATALAVIPDGPTLLRAEAEALRARVLAGVRRDTEASGHGERSLALAENLGAADVVSDAASTLARLAVRGGGDRAEIRRRFLELVDQSRRRVMSSASCAVCTSSRSCTTPRVSWTSPSDCSGRLSSGPRPPVGSGALTVSTVGCSPP